MMPKSNHTMMHVWQACLKPNRTLHLHNSKTTAANTVLAASLASYHDICSLECKTPSKASCPQPRLSLFPCQMFTLSEPGISPGQHLPKIMVSWHGMNTLTNLCVVCFRSPQQGELCIHYSITLAPLMKTNQLISMVVH